MDVTEQQQQTAWATPVMDARGNMTSLPKPAALASSLTATYDSWNRLVGASGTATYLIERR